MRRERKQQETERRFATRQARLRERRQRKINSLLLVSSYDSSDGSAVGDRRATREGMKRQAAEFLSASER
jgi:hypothetical protein